MSFERRRYYPRHICPSLIVDDELSDGHSAEGTSQPGATRGSAAATRTSCSRFLPGWSVSDHVVPAAFPRRFNPGHPPTRVDREPDSEACSFTDYRASSREERRGAAAATYELVRPRRRGERVEGDECVRPRLSLKRYAPTRSSPTGGSKREGITLFCGPGLGFCKEMFEPLVAQLLASLEGQVQIDEVWTLDLLSAAGSADLNPVGFGIADEKDVGRDMLAFLALHLPLRASPASEPPPYELPTRVPKNGDDVIPTRRRVYALAHSLCGKGGLLLSAHAPRLLEGLIVLDPPMWPTDEITAAGRKVPLHLYGMGLEEGFETRQQVRAHLDAAQRTKRWAGVMKDIFAEHGYRLDPRTGTLMLRTRPANELLTYHDMESPRQLHDRLEDVRTPLLWLTPKRPFGTPLPTLQSDFARLFPNDRLVVLERVTHTLLWEKPDVVATLVANWLVERCGTSAPGYSPARL